MKKGAQNSNKIKPKQPVHKNRQKITGTNYLIPVAVTFLLLIITWFLYQPSLKNKFVNWDDPDYVLENAQVKQLGVSNAAYFFTNSSAGNYHPLTMLSLSLDYHLAMKDNRLARNSDAPDVSVFHTTSLLLHLLNVLLVFVFFYLLSRKRLIVATVTALLFAIHPMHVESVAWVAERKDVLYTFFFLAGLIAYLQYLDKKGWGWVLVAGLLFVASLFSKPAAVVFPMVLFAMDYYYRRKFTVWVVMEKMPFFILAVLFGITTFLIQQHASVADIKVVSLFQRFSFASYGFIMYQYLLILPVKLSAFYPWPSLNASGNLPWFYNVSILLTIVIAGLVYYSTRFTRVLAFGYLFYLFCIVLVLQFMPVGSAIMADRYSYLSATGLFFIIGWYLDQTFIRKEKIFLPVRWVLTGLFLIYTVFLVKTAYERTKVWENSEILWTDAIAKYPESPQSYKNRGNYYADSSQLAASPYSSKSLTDKALKDYMVSRQMNPGDPGLLRSIGNIYAMNGEIDKALEAYSKSLAADNLDAATFLCRATTYSRIKQFDLALMDYQSSLKLQPDTGSVYQKMAYVLRDMGRVEESIIAFSWLLRHYPGSDNYYLERGVCFYQLKQYPKALADFEQCVALNPDNGNGYFNISVTCNELKDYRKAYQNAGIAISKKYPVDQNFFETLKIKGGG